MLNLLESLHNKNPITAERISIPFDFFTPQSKFNFEGVDENILNRALKSERSGKDNQQLYADFGPLQGHQPGQG
jgi:hypothetical protein